jgi:glycerol-3-phosphate dehydrogenase (NAD(P)+)
MSYISVIGAGSWGTTLACLLADKGYDTSLWVFEKELSEEMQAARTNRTYLPGVVIPDHVVITNDIEKAVTKSRYVLNVIPTQHTREIIKAALPYLSPDAVFINAAKGIERKTLLTVSSIISEVTHHLVAVLSGPSFAIEVARRLPTAVTLACRDIQVSLLLQEIFNTAHFRVYTHTDFLGAELGGALKNVIAIASGICDGLELGYNARAALLTRGLAEIERLGVSMGAEEHTFSGLSGLGDLILTCTGHLSRNYSVGKKLGQGMSLSDILSQSKSVAEGVTTAESAYELSRKYGVQMPIVEQIYLVLYHGKAPAAAAYDLMSRSLKTEFHA